MNWPEKEQELLRLGHGGFESEEHFEEWFSELDRVQQQPIIKALQKADQQPYFSWNKTYFPINKNNCHGNYNKVKQPKLPC